RGASSERAGGRSAGPRPGCANPSRPRHCRRRATRGTARRPGRPVGRGARRRRAGDRLRAGVGRVSGAHSDAWALDLVEAAGLIAAGKLKPSELVASALARLEAVEPFVRAFVSVDAERALREARDQDDRPGGPLRGIPVAIKDIFDVAGTPTCCGSAILGEAGPAREDAPAVAHLRAAGAVVVGKTTTHELACGVYTPPTRNPWDLERSP